MHLYGGVEIWEVRTLPESVDHVRSVAARGGAATQARGNEVQEIADQLEISMNSHESGCMLGAAQRDHFAQFALRKRSWV
jgi:hypothetical protein